MHKMKRVFSIICLLVLSMSAYSAMAQTDAPKTPFPYPTAPDTCSTLESRCNYIVTNFWNNYNIARPITNDADFETAFRDYVNIVKYCHRNIAISSVRDFIFKARSNSANLLKIGKVAESALYGPYAEYWSDELYTEIAKALSESTNLKQADRNYYKHQVAVISKCPVNGIMPEFDIVLAEGKKSKLSEIEAQVYLVFFTDDNTNSIIDRTRLSTDVAVNNLIAGENIKVIQIKVGKHVAGWADNMPENWINVSSEQVANIIDLRGIPSCYILDKDRKILTKNVSVDDVKSAFN